MSALLVGASLRDLLDPVLHEEIHLQTVQLVRLGAESGEFVTDRRDRLRRWLIDILPFACIVVVPTLLAAIYLFSLATDRYRSEMGYVVRTPGSAATNEIASIVQGSGISRSSDDAYIAREYIKSRDAMQRLIDQDGLLAMFNQAGPDLLWRYPLFGTPKNEGLLKHYLRFVNVAYDTSSGVSVLTVDAFDPADAQRLARAILVHTETFLNGLNARAQKDAVDSAVGDVDRAKQAAYAALDAVTAFRNAEETLDPTKASAGIVSSISALSLETATSNARLAELMTNSPQSPEIPTLRTRIGALNDQITKQRQQLGGDDASLAPRIARYQRLLLQQQFAEKAFISALSSLEVARLDATRQRIFVERVTDADLPDQPVYPYRVTSLLVVFGIALLVWWVAHVIGKDSREHAHK